MDYTLSFKKYRSCIPKPLALLLISKALFGLSSASVYGNTQEPVLQKTQYVRNIQKFEYQIEHSDYPSISAAIKKYNERNPENVELNWVSLSPIGMRIRDVSSRSEVIKNFEQQKVWLVNGVNKTRYEVDVDFFKRHFPDQVPNLLGAHSISNISGMVPCADLVPLKNGERFWRGQVVEEWNCSTDEGTLYSTQLFSTRWNIVVRVKHSDLSIEELTDISEEQFLYDNFLPAENMVSVEFDEFMTGRRNLDTYSP